MTGKRERYPAEFKAKVAMEALRGELTISQLATKHGVHQTMIGEWKSQAMEGLVGVDRAAMRVGVDQPVVVYHRPTGETAETFALMRLINA